MAQSSTDQTAAPRSPGRPIGTGASVEKQRKPRSVRLADFEWAKLQRLGSTWLSTQINQAKEPEIDHSNAATRTKN